MKDIDTSALMQRLHSDPAGLRRSDVHQGTRIPSPSSSTLSPAGTRSRFPPGYPGVKREDVAAALEYGARLAHERIPARLASSS